MSVETKYHVIFIRISPFSSVAKSVLYAVSFEDSSLAAMSTDGNCQSHHYSLLTYVLPFIAYTYH